MMKIIFDVIPHSEQRYDTCGDYVWRDDTLHFRVSKLSDHKYEWLVFLHELTEYALAMFGGVPTTEIDAFDIAYEHARKDGHAPCGCVIQEEPGFDRHAPYHWQHRMADIVERACAFALGIDWIAYNREIDAL